MSARENMVNSDQINTNAPYSVVLIDDEYWALKGLLNSYDWAGSGFQIKGCYMDPIQALEDLQISPPDIVFTDVCMDSLNGLELISNLRSEQKIREFVVVSGYDRFDFVQQSLRLGVFDYLLKPIDREELAALMQRLSDHLSIMPETDMETIVINDAPVKHDAVDQILKYINQHYADTLTLRMLSREFYLTETYICDLLKKYTGKTFVAILQEIRLNQAKRLLSETSITIAEVGRQVGYTDQGYFSRIFRRMECMSPMQYRIKTRQER